MHSTNTMTEFDYYISPDGKEYLFANRVNRFLWSFTGYGFPEPEFRTTRGPFQNGASVVDMVLRPRVITLIHQRNDRNREGYWRARSDLLNHLRQNRQTSLDAVAPGTLRKILPDGSIRDINVFLENGPAFVPQDTVNWDHFSFKDSLRFIAYDPTFYDPALNEASFTITGVNRLIFPITFVESGCPEEECGDIMFMTAVVSESYDLNYDGTAITYPTLILEGPMESPLIENVTLGLKLKLEYNIAVGETVTIDLRYGYKTVESDVNGNKIGVLSSDSDLARWCIAHDPIAPGGVNEISAAFSGADLDSAIRIQYYTRYYGI